MAESDVEGDLTLGVQSFNRKSKKSGGFQSMGLDYNVLKGVLKRGYKIPTPIQRKTIPLILNGKDVVAMARTGSGKTAAFLIPLFQRLKCRSPKAGARAVLISPTRELALQTFKFTKDLNRFIGLNITTLVGGDNMEEQFAAIHENPDVIIATPGRLLHVAVEMNLKLKSVEYIVFDEADRLFEMGFEEQLKDVIRRLSENRQTLLFSATLPKSLVDFVRVGLNQPTLVRLDVDSKISDKLNMSFLVCRLEDKLPLLMHLLRRVINVENEQTIVFCATKHHVEYLKEVLTLADFKCSFVYSSLDPTARKSNIERFRKRLTQILIVTDLAARGIDIPLLDNVINFHFPTKSKLFVHRVGRVARAGCSGRAFSLVSHDEFAYVVDLHLFLGRPLKLHKANDKIDDKESSDVIGSVLRSAVDTEEELIRQLHDGKADLEFLRQGALNAFKKYMRTKPTPSRESVERVKKEKMAEDLALHPIFESEIDSASAAQTISILDQLRNYKPQATVLEWNCSSKHQSYVTMKAKRKAHEKFLVQKENELNAKSSINGLNSSSETVVVEQIPENEIKNVFTEVIESKFRKNGDIEKIALKNKTKNKRRQTTTKDSEYFLPYKPSDFHSEAGLSVERSDFEHQATAAVVDFMADDSEGVQRQKNKLKWDRKRKKFVSNEETKVKKIRTESGVWIPASYKSDLYAKWKSKSKTDSREDACDGEDSDGGNEKQNKHFGKQSFGRGRWPKKGAKTNTVGQFNTKNRKGRREIKSKEEILKERKRKERIKNYEAYKKEHKSKKSSNKRKQH